MLGKIVDGKLTYPPHRIVLDGEYMIWTDGYTYLCKEDTNFSPEDYPQAWENA